MNPTNSQLAYTEKIDLALDYIAAHISEEITLETLSAEACFSPFHFHRIFTAITGETPRDFIERCKLERAANRLCVAPDRTILETALDSGYTSISSFSRAFRKYYHTSPSQFLKQHILDYHSIGAPESKRTKHYVKEDFAAVSIRTLPMYHYAYKQVFSGYANGIPSSWEKLLRFADAYDLITNETTHFGIPFDNPGITPREKCRYRACITVPDTFTRAKGEIRTAEISAGKYAIFPFEGTREEIGDAYAKIYGGWLPQSGYLPDDKPSLELYPPELHRSQTQQLQYEIALPIVPI